mmetsp:Transcript_8693/g.15494  ORF Transcript_8693/g.15494 Transcript_8693/m.15494 type:complete len:261 (+) Transcript_8693:2-784(+)
MEMCRGLGDGTADGGRDGRGKGRADTGLGRRTGSRADLRGGLRWGPALRGSAFLGVVGAARGEMCSVSLRHQRLTFPRDMMGGCGAVAGRGAGRGLCLGLLEGGRGALFFDGVKTGTAADVGTAAWTKLLTIRRLHCLRNSCHSAGSGVSHQISVHLSMASSHCPRLMLSTGEGRAPADAPLGLLSSTGHMPMSKPHSTAATRRASASGMSGNSAVAKVLCISRYVALETRPKAFFGRTPQSSCSWCWTKGCRRMTCRVS